MYYTFVEAFVVPRWYLKWTLFIYLPQIVSHDTRLTPGSPKREYWTTNGQFENTPVIFQISHILWGDMTSSPPPPIDHGNVMFLWRYEHSAPPWEERKIQIYSPLRELFVITSPENGFPPVPFRSSPFSCYFHSLS